MLAVDCSLLMLFVVCCLWLCIAGCRVSFFSVVIAFGWLVVVRCCCVVAGSCCVMLCGVVCCC